MQQKLTIPNKRGEKLTGVLHETGSDKIVVVCHGYTCTKDYNMMIDIATALENEGISAFRFDFSGNGESEGSFQFANYQSEIEDLRSVVEYFTGQKRSTVAVLGHSKGGDVVLLYASKYHDIPAVVNVSGRYDLKEGLEGMLGGKDFKERFERDGYIDLTNRDGKVLCKVTQDHLTERLTTNMREACLSIDKKCKVLTVHGTEDDDHPVKDAHEFAKCIPNHKLHIIEGANHEFSDHRAELITTILTFIKESLHADSSDTSK